MYTISVQFTCLPKMREAFVERVRNEGIYDAILKEEGCLLYDYYYSEKDENELLLIEAWESKEHQQIHITQPHMDKLRSLKDDYILETKLSEFEMK